MSKNNKIKIKVRRDGTGTVGAPLVPGETRILYIADDAAPDFGDATDAEKEQYGYICEDTELMADGTAPYVIY